MTEPGRATDGTAAERSTSDGPTAEQPVVAPSVSTAPARFGPFSRIPSHLGRARTSTVVLALLFVGIFALYLTIRPEEQGAASNPPGETGTEQPAPAPTTTEPAPETTAEPTTTAPEPTDPTTAPEETTEEPSDTTVPEETTEPTPPTDASPTGRPSTPTVVSPPG